MGYNHAESPIETLPGTDKLGAIVNMLNLLGFPATSEDHHTAGAGYRIDKEHALDIAFVYAPEKTTSANLSGLGLGDMSIENEYREISFMIQYTYAY